MSRSGPEGRILPRNACDVAEFGVLHQVQAVTAALLEGGHEVVVFGVDDVARLARFLANERPDIVFNCCESLHRNAGLEMNVAALYKLFGIPFTGSSALTLGVALNKALAKAMFQAQGIPTPPYLVFPPGAALAASEAYFRSSSSRYREDAGIGIDENSVVETRERAVRAGALYLEGIRSAGVSRGVHRRAGAERGRAGGLSRPADRAARLRNRLQRTSRPTAPE